MKSDRAISHCAREVRRHDHDRYLCAMFADAAARNRLFALYALNLELARIAELVSEPALGEIRLQWWRDTIEGVYRDSPRDHPVATALTGTGAARLLPRRSIENLIDARAGDLDEAPIRDRSALMHYAERTSSALLGLALDLLEVTDARAQAAVHPLGRAWAVTGIIRATGHLARRGRTLLPADVMSKYGLTKDMVLRGTPADALQNAVTEIASWAQQDLAAACAEPTPRAALPVMLTASLTRAYLKRLRRAKYDPYEPRLTMSPVARHVRLIAHAVRNRP